MNRFAPILALFLFASSSAYAVISLGGTTGWVAIQYDGQTDYITDQRTGQPEADLIGQPGYSSFYKSYYDGGSVGTLDDDFIGFRFRVRSDDGPTGFSKYGFVGIDANNDGSVDVFVGGNQDGINFYSPGTGLNVSPNTTTVDKLTATDQYMGNVVTWELGNSASVVNFSAVNSVDTSLNFVDKAPFANLDPSHDDYIGTSKTADLDGGGEVDRFFSFQVDMLTLMKAIYVSTEQNTNPENPTVTLDLLSEMTFMMVTSTQENSFNQDLNGQDGDALNYLTTGKDDTWVELGGASEPYTADGDSPVPEPSTYALMMGLLALGFVANRRRK